MDDGEDARRVWGGAVPLNVHLHDADVTALPPPSPFLVHFSRYPAAILSPCEGEDSVKWSYNNSLKEAAFIIAGNSKNVMNMSQADQVAMWESVKNGDLDGYMNIFTRLKLGPFEQDCLVRTSSTERQQGSDDPEPLGGKPCRVPVRLYVRRVQEDLEYLEDVIPVSDWESVSYINRPFEIRKEKGRGHITLAHALETLLPEFFGSKDDSEPMETPDSAPDDSDTTPRALEGDTALTSQREADVAKKAAKVKLVRVHGVESGMDIPFLWLANNLKNPECYLHICVYISA